MSKHQRTIKTTIKTICPVAFSRIFVWKLFFKLLSEYLGQSLFLVKFHASSIFFWTPLDEWLWSMKSILWETSCFRHLRYIQVADWIYTSLIAKTFDGIILKMEAASPIKVIENKNLCFRLFLDLTRTLFCFPIFYVSYRARKGNSSPRKSGAIN